MTQNVTKPTPLYSTLGSDPDLGELVEMFVAEMPERIEKLTELFERAEWEDLRRSAHQLKGAAGSYGFLEISPLAAIVEDKIREDRPEKEIHEALQSLCEMCRCARPGTPE